MSFSSWRLDQLLALTIAIVLSLGAGFAGGYFVGAAKVVADAPAMMVLDTAAAPIAGTGYDLEDDRALREEHPMDGLMGSVAPDIPPPAP
jgi:hypothetical protein